MPAPDPDTPAPEPLTPELRAHETYRNLHNHRGNALPYIDAIPVLTDAFAVALADAERAGAARMRERVAAFLELPGKHSRTLREVAAAVRSLPLS